MTGVPSFWPCSALHLISLFGLVSYHDWPWWRVYRWIAAQHSQDFTPKDFSCNQKFSPKNIEISGEQEGKTSWFPKLYSNFCYFLSSHYAFKKGPIPLYIFVWLLSFGKGGPNPRRCSVRTFSRSKKSSPNIWQLLRWEKGRTYRQVIDRVIFVRSKGWVAGVYRNDHPRVS